MKIIKSQRMGAKNLGGFIPEEKKVHSVQVPAASPFPVTLTDPYPDISSHLEDSAQFDNSSHWKHFHLVRYFFIQTAVRPLVCMRQSIAIVCPSFETVIQIKLSLGE